MSEKIRVSAIMVAVAALVWSTLVNAQGVAEQSLRSRPISRGGMWRAPCPT
jgi:hypothetical protein